MGKIVILAGNYGSGKTELALNLAIEFAKSGRTALVDIDIVNPYFRSAEHKALMEQHGIRLIASDYANTLVDVPVIGAEIFSALDFEYAVFDAGGDPVGASVLGSIAYRMPKEGDVHFYYVVNARRPLQKNADEIIEMMKLIEEKARIRATGIVNNTNLARETTVQDLLYGRDVCREVSMRTGVPVVFTSGERTVLKEYRQITGEEDTVELLMFTRPDWLDSTV